MDAVGDCAGARQVIAVAGAVPVHRGEKDFTRAKAGEANGMFDSVNACGAAAAVGEDLPPAGPDRARIDRTHHALIAELARHFADQLRPGDGRRIDRNLVGSGKQQGACILHRTDAAADRQRHEADRRRAGDDVQNRAASFMAGGDVEEAKLVRALRVIDARLFDRIARVLQGNEVHALYDPAAGHVEAGDAADGDGHPGRSPAIYSAWASCVPPSYVSRTVPPHSPPPAWARSNRRWSPKSAPPPFT